MTWIRKNYKLTVALLAMSTAFFTWSANNGGPLAILSSAQVAKLEQKIEKAKKDSDEKIKEVDKEVENNRANVQELQVKQAKDTAEIKAGLEAVKKELGEQRNDTRQVRNDTQEVLRLLVKIQSKL